MTFQFDIRYNDGSVTRSFGGRQKRGREGGPSRLFFLVAVVVVGAAEAKNIGGGGADRTKRQSN